MAAPAGPTWTVWAGGTSAVRACTAGTGMRSLGAVGWAGSMALCCGCTGRSLCNHRVHCNDEVVDSDQEGPAGREREEGQERRECVCWVGSTECSCRFDLQGTFKYWRASSFTNIVWPLYHAWEFSCAKAIPSHGKTATLYKLETSLSKYTKGKKLNLRNIN